MTDLISKQDARSMVATYEQALVEIKQAFDLLASAKAKLGGVIGERSLHLFPDSSISEFDLTASSDKVALYVREQLWRYIIDTTQLRRVMTARRLEEMEKQISKGELPELTAETIEATLVQMIEDSGTMLKEYLAEVFEWVRSSGWELKDFKTNKPFELGRKIIKAYVLSVNTWGNSRDVSLPYNSERPLQALHNVFSLLDGQGMVQYPNDLATEIKAAIQKKEWSCEDEYFKVRWFKKGTMHIEFLRADLVEELNRRGGGKILKPDTKNREAENALQRHEAGYA